MSASWPINWRTGGIAWSMGPMGNMPSLFVCWRFGKVDGEKPNGFILRYLPAARRLRLDRYR